MRDQKQQGERAFAVMRAMTCLGLVCARIIVYGITWAPLDKPKVAMTIGFLMLIVTIVCLPNADAKVLSVAGTQPTALKDLLQSTRERYTHVIVDHSLTAREAEVFSLLMDDLNLGDIARELGVSNATVHTHVQHVYNKFNVHSRKELQKAVETKS